MIQGSICIFPKKSSICMILVCDVKAAKAGLHLSVAYPSENAFKFEWSSKQDN